MRASSLECNLIGQGSSGEPFLARARDVNYRGAEEEGKVDRGTKEGRRREREESIVSRPRAGMDVIELSN